MRTTTASFDLKSWRLRIGFTQSAAAAALGLSLATYREAEYRSMDQEGAPVRKTVALLAQALEREHIRRAVRDAYAFYGLDPAHG
jgi:transcriptional regulator with XRE-family HTH domain